MLDIGPARSTRFLHLTSRRFVEIVQAEPATTPAVATPSRDLTIEIALPCGTVVRVGSGVEVESLRCVLRALT